MYIVPRWDYLCSDSWWVFYSLSWMTDGKQANKGETVHLRLSQRRPAMFEVLDMTPDRSAIYSVLHPSELVAQLRTSRKTRSITSASGNGQHHEETFVVRSSDLSLIWDCPYGYLYRIMDDGIVNDRAPLEMLDLTVHINDVVATLTEGTRVTVRVTYVDDLNIQCSLLVGDLLVAEMQMVLFKSRIISRYEKGRLLMPASTLYDVVSQTANRSDHVVTSLPVSMFETSGPAAMATGLLHYSDAAKAVVWGHIFPRSSPIYSTLAPDGKQVCIVLYRGAVVEVFSWPRPGSTILCTTWLAKTGSTTFDIRVDIRDEENVPIATSQITMVVVDRIKMKSHPVFHDKSWGEERYKSSIETCLPADVSTPDALKNSPKDVFEHPLGTLRHSDHDQNGHVNSAKYFNLVHDARAGALKADFFPEKVRRVVERDGWIKRYGIDYILELRMDNAKNPVVRVSYQITEETDDNLKVLVLFEISDGKKLCTRAWVESRSEFDSTQARPSNPSSQPLLGSLPEQWGVNSTILHQRANL